MLTLFSTTLMLVVISPSSLSYAITPSKGLNSSPILLNLLLVIIIGAVFTLSCITLTLHLAIYPPSSVTATTSTSPTFSPLTIHLSLSPFIIESFDSSLIYQFIFLFVASFGFIIACNSYSLLTLTTTSVLFSVIPELKQPHYSTLTVNLVLAPPCAIASTSILPYLML